MSSNLTDSEATLKAALITSLSEQGYAYNNLTTSFNEYLATALTGLSGSMASHLRMSRNELLAGIARANGGSASHLTNSYQELLVLAASPAESGGEGGDYAPKAVHIDNSAANYWTMAAPFAGKGDGSKFLFAGWIGNDWLGLEPQEDVVFLESYPNAYMGLFSTNQFNTVSGSPIGQAFYLDAGFAQFDTDENIFRISGLSHIILLSDLNHPDPDKRFQTLVNGVLVDGSYSSSGTGADAIVLPLSSEDTMFFGTDGYGADASYDAADWQFWQDITLPDLSDPDVIAALMGDPADAAVMFGTQQALFQRTGSDPNEFAENKGNGGTATLTGSLLLATFDPTLPINVVAPAIADWGTYADLATAGRWRGNPQPTASPTYQWYRDGVAIDGETGTSYTYRAHDGGSTIQIAEIKTNTTGSAHQLSNGVTATEPPPVNIEAPEITGTTGIGDTLTTTDGTWDGVEPIEFTYEWQRNGDPIVGETASTYVIAAEDSGADIQVVVTATNSAGSNSWGSNVVSIP